jgi:phosphatidylethanolamine-binding protein (PEBP) family uncharacterized protein
VVDEQVNICEVIPPSIHHVVLLAVLQANHMVLSQPRQAPTKVLIQSINQGNVIQGAVNANDITRAVFFEVV